MIQAKGSSWEGSQDLSSDVKADIVVNTLSSYTASGAILETNATVYLNAASALAMTLAKPIANDDDGKHLVIRSLTAYAHTVTCTTGINGGGTSVLTFPGNVGDVIELEAFNGYWYTDLELDAGLNGVTGANGVTGSLGVTGSNGASNVDSIISISAAAGAGITGTHITPTKWVWANLNGTTGVIGFYSM